MPGVTRPHAIVVCSSVSDLTCIHPFKKLLHLEPTLYIYNDNKLKLFVDQLLLFVLSDWVPQSGQLFS